MKLWISPESHVREPFLQPFAALRVCRPRLHRACLTCPNRQAYLGHMHEIAPGLPGRRHLYDRAEGDRTDYSVQAATWMFQTPAFRRDMFSSDAFILGTPNAVTAYSTSGHPGLGMLWALASAVSRKPPEKSAMSTGLAEGARTEFEKAFPTAQKRVFVVRSASNVNLCQLEAS